MSLPSAVLEQDRIADELLAADQAARKLRDETPEPEVVAPVATPPVVVPPVTDPVAVAATDPPPLKPADDATWQARYNTLQGKYHAEVPRLHATIRERDATIKKLTDAPPKPTESLLTEAEIEKYGPEFWDAVRRAATEQNRDIVRQLDELKGNLTRDADIVTDAAKAAYFTTITAAHDDWEAIDTDDKFVAWLKVYDPTARATRQALLNDAISSLDATYVITLLDEWKASNKARPPTPPVTPPAVPPANLEPSTSKADPPAEVPKKIWKQSEIKAFYQKHSKGGYTEAEAVQIEQEIQLATTEHRVR